MDNVLKWDKPKKAMSTEAWQSIIADNAPPGVYTPNMSKDDMFRWKAKHIKGVDERVEIRKTFQHKGKKLNSYYSAQVCIIVSKSDTPKVLISTNGKIAMTEVEFNEFQSAINEALSVLNRKDTIPFL